MTLQLNVCDLLQRREYDSLRRGVDGRPSTVRIPALTAWRRLARFTF